MNAVRPGLFMTVPTAGRHPDLLADLIDHSGLPGSQIVVVATRPGIVLPEDCVVVEDFGAPNVQRWWTRGIDEAAIRGASVVAVANDDIIVRPETIAELDRALRDTGATVASPGQPPQPDGLHRRSLIPYSRRMSGCLWLLDLNTSLRPDPRYVWWYGDNDIDIRARRDYNGVVTLPVYCEHVHPGEETARSPLLAHQVRLDERTFRRSYFWLLTLSGVVRRWLRVWNRITARSS